MERFVFAVLELTGGTLFSPQFDGAITANPEQLPHIPDDLSPCLVESWQQVRSRSIASS
ncbi:hypothetical protein GPX89_39550 [Nocardia sp. ET3-3]|uniref:Uncharacterized protein n=1 Tax=Nocardia terrae TaxID=2675851 RepID=A0A7K1VA09_9NOCA|nr:hypothetical protein [Nocardia terrae]MVU83321.1 hypothetical protein [Nocardia terrae]